MKRIIMLFLLLFGILLAASRMPYIHPEHHRCYDDALFKFES